MLRVVCALAATFLAMPASGEALSPCDRIDPRSMSIGARCVTKSGFRFKLAHRAAEGKEIWLDEASQTFWGDALTERIRRKAAAGLCRKRVEGETAFGDQLLRELPTSEDFTLGERHGFREVLPHMRDHFYWIDAAVKGAANVGYVFNGNLGKPELVVYRSINFENVRCVGRGR